MSQREEGNLPDDVLRDLDSFDPAVRASALETAVRAIASGDVAVPPVRDISNVHAHTFHSYSIRDYSPSRLVWEAVRRGLSVVGSTDFDVLSAMDEMYSAGAALGIRATVSLETRAFVESYADREINSPGEPGVMYVMGVGFTRMPGADTLFPSLVEQSRSRNLEMIGKINPVLGPGAIDYAVDVLPLTPSGNATERHICAACDVKARAVFSGTKELAAHWAGVLGVSTDEAEKLVADSGALRNTIRAKLMKRGGVGYAQPGKGSFPRVEDFFAMVAGARAVPCQAWLDGLSAGESDPGRLQDDAMSWGARVVNVIPERNWNIADPGMKKRKLAALDAFVRAARERHLPVLAGTEMNGPGQRFVDAFEAPELAPYVGDFQDAAYWLYGHTVMERLAGKGVMSEWAAAAFAGDRAAGNAFYTEAGRAASPRMKLTNRTIADGASPAEALAILKE